MNFCAFVAFVRPFALVRVCPGKGSGSVDCRLCRGCHLVIVTSCRIFGQQATHSKQTNEASRIGRRINPHRGLHHTLQRPLSTHTHTHTKRHSRARSSPQGSHSRQSREGGGGHYQMSLVYSCLIPFPILWSMMTSLHDGPRRGGEEGSARRDFHGLLLLSSSIGSYRF